MISSNYYKENNLVSLFGNGLQHYLIKQPSTTIISRDYAVQSGDSMYTLAKKLFGPDREYNWTIIADLNYLRRPYDLVVGEIIKLPVIVLDDTRFNKVNYDSATSATTKI